MKCRALTSTALAAALTTPAPAPAADYVIDTREAHAFIQFRIKHLGFSWLLGRFNDFEGRFSYNKQNPDASRVEVTVRTASIDSNHAERDKHLRGEDFLNVNRYPEARFVSTSFREHDDNTATLTGDLTLHGVTRPVTIDVEHIGHGPDPWGGYRRGFAGSTSLRLSDFGIDYDLGPAAREVELFLSVEGIRQ
ncbi:MAG: YceI family protein [Gammaproteobacteria bacterium]|jgi:polyisoprenoid-binding protein YceI